MRIFWRSFVDYWTLRRLFLPLLVLIAIATPLALMLPLVEKRFVDKVVLARRIDLIVPTLLLYAALWLGSTVTSRVGVVALRTYLEERFSLHMRQRVFAHCETLSLPFLQDKHSGQIVSLFFNDIPSLTSLFSGTLITGYASLLGIGIGVGLMLSLNWQLALATGVLPPLAAAVGVLLTRRLRPVSRQLQGKAGDLAQRIQENLSGIREIAAFGQEETQQIGFLKTLNELLWLRMRMTFIDIGIGTGTNVFSLAVIAVVFGFGGLLVIEGRTTLGTLVAMQLLYEHVAQPVSQLFGVGSSIQKALGAADRVYGLLDEKPAVADRAGALAPPSLVGKVQFEHVSFAYIPDRLTLQDVTFSVEPGESIALVGPSGAGKTTLVSLILRLYDPVTGKVLIDGTDIRDFTLKGLRSQVAIVFQDTHLFAMSIRENILMSRPDAGDGDVRRAAHAANAWEFIEQLPNGLDTYVGERGVQLSQGQRQRLAIARAFLRDPRVVILDEPTSALDAINEHLIQVAIANLRRDRTTFVIAHRLTTIRHADRIFVLDQGRIVEQGTHEELLQRHGLYHQQYDLQFGNPETLTENPVLESERLVAG